MQIILLERVARLGNMGDTVEVKDGFARNFLLPEKKALRATAANRSYFESRRAELESRNKELRSAAEQHIGQFRDRKFTIIRAAGETGHLYGSVSPRDIAKIVSAEGFAISRNNVKMDHPIKTIGLHPVNISLHPEVEVEIILNVARTEEEAERQAKGEDMTKIDKFAEEEAEAPAETETSAEAEAEAEEAKEYAEKAINEDEEVEEEAAR